MVESVQTLRFWRVLVVTWIGYAAYTMARRPFSVGRKAIEADTGLSKYMSSMVDTSFLILYTIGQLMYGTYIKGYTSSKNILVIGLLGSALMCLLVALSSNALIFIGAWGLNGAFQAAGWASCMTVITPWLNPSERGVVMGLWGTNMAVGGVIGNALTASLIDQLGSWRGAVIVDVMILVAVALMLNTFLRSHPNKEGVLTPQQISEGRNPEEVFRAPRSLEGEAILSPLESALSSSAGPSSGGSNSTPQSLTVKQTLAIPGVSGIAFSYFFHKLVRYSLMFWLPYLFTTELGYDTTTAGIIASVLDVGGILGTIASGYFSDWYCKGQRRAMSVMFFVAGMAVSVLLVAFNRDVLVVSKSFAAVVSFLVGFNSFAIDSLMSSSLQQDLAERQRVSGNIGDISGVVGGVGTAGSILQGVLTAYLSDRSWESLFSVLAGLTIFAGFFMVTPLKLERVKATHHNSGV